MAIKLNLLLFAWTANSIFSYLNAYEAISVKLRTASIIYAFGFAVLINCCANWQKNMSLLSCSKLLAKFLRPPFAYEIAYSNPFSPIYYALLTLSSLMRSLILSCSSKFGVASNSERQSNASSMFLSRKLVSIRNWSFLSKISSECENLSMLISKPLVEFINLLLNCSQL